MSKSMLFQRGGLLKFGAVIGFLVVIAVILGWRAGFTPPPTLTVAPEGSWSLPKLASDDPAKDLATLASRKPWGTGAPSLFARQAKPAAPPSWRLAGVVQRGGQSYALIASGVPRPQFEYRSVGDKLPDGSTLVEITADGAVVEGGPAGADGKRSYRLFGKN